MSSTTTQSEALGERIREFRTDLERLKGRQEQMQGVLKAAEEEVKRLGKELEYSKAAQAILQAVAVETQEQVQFHISDLVSSSLEIFPNPYTFLAEFVMKRGKTECEFRFQKGEKKMRPLDAAGGGPVDVAAFALRPSIWCLSPKSSRSRPTFIFDEPFKHLSRDLHSQASLMLKQLSEHLGIQIIVVSHSADLVEGADKVFEVSIRGGVSHVE